MLSPDKPQLLDDGSALFDRLPAGLIMTVQGLQEYLRAEACRSVFDGAARYRCIEFKILLQHDITTIEIIIDQVQADAEAGLSRLQLIDYRVSAAIIG